MQEEEDSGVSRPRSRSRPLPPSPSSTHSEVRAFIADYLLFADYVSTQTQAEAKARRACMSGASVYTLPEEQWRSDFGNAGHDIFEYLRNSKYGYLSRVASGPIFRFLSTYLTISDLPVEQKVLPRKAEVVASQSVQSSSSLLQQEYIDLKSCVGPRESLNGITSQTDLKLGMQGNHRHQEDSGTVRLRR